MTICCISFDPYRSIREQIWPYHKKWTRSTQCHHLNQFGSTWVIDALYQVSMSSASWFRRRTLFKIFTIYGLGSHLGHVTLNIWTNFHPNIPWRLKFGFKRPKCFLRKRSLKMLNLSVNEWPWPWVVMYSYIWLYIPTFTSRQQFLGNLQL